MSPYEKFITALACREMTEPSYRGLLAEAGIILREHLTPSFQITRTYNEFCEELKKCDDFYWASQKVNREVSATDHVLELRKVDVPNQPQPLAAVFNLLKHHYGTSLLGKRMVDDPSSATELINEFTLKYANPVKWDWIENFTDECFAAHDKSIVENKVLIKIPGFELLSEMIGGFNPCRTAILTGSTGFGKTNFGLNLALSARKNLCTAYANMEMSFQDMTRRLAVISSGEGYGEFNSHMVSDKVKSIIREYPHSLAMTSGRALSLNQIKAWVSALLSEKKVDLLIIDYDQKLELSMSRETPEWKALQNSIEQMEDIAKEFNLYIIVLAQVNREGDISGSFRATFPAHTVLHFENHDEYGPIIAAKKNRHGKKNQAVKVSYNEFNSQIKETEIITIEKRKSERKTLKENRVLNMPYSS